MDQREFSSRIEQLKEKLYRTAYLYVGDEVTALEMVDETIFRGLKSLKKLRQPEYFNTWMTRILINLCKDELKRRSRLQPVETIPETAEEMYDNLPLKLAILRLPEVSKEVIILRYFSDYTLAETADTLAIPQGTVVTKQRRALALLKLDLSEEDEDESIG